MKIPFIYLTLFLSSVSMLLLMDVLSGMPLRDAVGIVIRSFSVTSYIEKIVLALALILPFLIPMLKRFMPSRNK